MVNSKDYNHLPLVPESVLKRRHDLDDLRRKKQAMAEEKGSSKRPGTYVKKPETFLAQAKNRRNEQARYRRVKKKGMMKRASNKPVVESKEIQLSEDQVDVISYQANSAGASMVFAIRIREDAGPVPKQIYLILAQLGLKEANTGIFVKYDAATRKKLHLVEPWVIYGKPSEGIVKDLIERKSFGNVNGEKIPLSDNTIIERELGEEHGIICMEDLVHELTNTGDSFGVVTKFLWPFPLSAARSNFEKTKLSRKQGKDYGDKGEEIDEYIKTML
jgi:large subunit ribosomal protein L7e